MSTPASTPAAPRRIHLEAPNYILRAVESDDVTDRWAAWLADPANMRMLNATPMALNVDDIRKYVAGFDHVKAHILGIFERVSGKMIGFWEVYIDWTHREFLLNILIGDHGEGPKQPRRETLIVLLGYFFGNLGLETMRCSVLATNTRVVNLFAARGFLHEHTSKQPSAVDGEPLDILHYSVTRAVWAAMRAERIARERAAAAGQKKSGPH